MGTTTALLTSLALIDTHCHVHIGSSLLQERQKREDGKQAASQICCNAGDDPDPPISNGPHDDRYKDIDEDTFTRRQQDIVSSTGSHQSDDVAKGSVSSDATSHVSVVQVPMGIEEDDWDRAIAYGTARVSTVATAADGSEYETADMCETVRHGQMNQGGEDGERRRQEQELKKQQTAIEALDEGSFRFGMGLHPWRAHSRTESWLRDLTALLEKHPQALVGEIGLDKVARTPETRRVEWSDQLEVFHAQMALAARLSRPVSVHCVKAHGRLADVLRARETSVSELGKGSTRLDGTRDEGVASNGRRLPPRIALHSFTGSVEVAKDICRNTAECEVFFGFSAAVNMRGDGEQQRLLATLRVIPESSVLIETDGHSPAGAREQLMRVCGVIAEAKEVSLEEAMALANRNARRFLSALAKFSGRLPIPA